MTSLEEHSMMHIRYSQGKVEVNKKYRSSEEELRTALFLGNTDMGWKPKDYFLAGIEQLSSSQFVILCLLSFCNHLPSKTYNLFDSISLKDPFGFINR